MCTVAMLNAKIIIIMSKDSTHEVSVCPSLILHIVVWVQKLRPPAAQNFSLKGA